MFEQILPCGCDGGSRLGRSELDNRRRATSLDLSLDLQPHLHPPGGVRAEEISDTRGKLAITVRVFTMNPHSSPKEFMNKPSADYGRRIQWVFAGRSAPRTAVYLVARSLLELEPMMYLCNTPIHGFKVVNKRVIRSAHTNSFSESQTDIDLVKKQICHPPLELQIVETGPQLSSNKFVAGLFKPRAAMLRHVMLPAVEEIETARRAEQNSMYVRYI